MPSRTNGWPWKKEMRPLFLTSWTLSVQLRLQSSDVSECISCSFFEFKLNNQENKMQTLTDVYHKVWRLWFRHTTVQSANTTTMTCIQAVPKFRCRIFALPKTGSAGETQVMIFNVRSSWSLDKHASRFMFHTIVSFRIAVIAVEIE